MSVDEQPAEPKIEPSLAAKVPHMVYNQLSNDFLPAAKEVGHAGIILLKSYKSLQEALTGYCSATHKLIKSADSAGGKSKLEAVELSKVFKKFVEGVTAHQKIIAEFEALATKVADYSSQDKEKMKQEYGEFKKSEKKVLKKKSVGTSKSSQEFYKKEAADWLKQQELRYKFFNEKIGHWINSYVEMAQSLNLAPSASLEKSNENSAQDAVANTDSHDKEAKEEEATKEVQSTNIMTNDSKPIVTINQSEDTKSVSSDSSEATTLDEIPSLRRPTIETAGVVLVHHEKKRNSISIQPIPNPVVKPSQHNNSRAPAEAPLPAPREQEVISYVPLQFNGNVAYKQTVPDAPFNHAPGVAPRTGRTFPGAVPVFGLADNRPNVFRKPDAPYSPQQLQNGNGYEVVTQRQLPVGRVVETAVTAEEMNKKRYHVDSEYVVGASPSHQPQKQISNRHENEEISVPSSFNPSQYGSILIVNDDFNASSGAQMTVNRGDKVILLKCGARGWVFVRDSISNRTGWIPEPYVSP